MEGLRRTSRSSSVRLSSDQSFSRGKTSKRLLESSTREQGRKETSMKTPLREPNSLADGIAGPCMPRLPDPLPSGCSIHDSSVVRFYLAMATVIEILFFPRDGIGGIRSFLLPIPLAFLSLLLSFFLSAEVGTAKSAARDDNVDPMLLQHGQHRSHRRPQPVVPGKIQGLAWVMFRAPI